MYLAITKISKFQKPLEVFNSLNEGITIVRNLAEQFKIDHRFCKLTSTNQGELFEIVDETPMPDSTEHNIKIEKTLLYLSAKNLSFAIVDKGRTPDEKSFIWIENGHFYGMGYITSDVTIVELSEIKEYLTPYKSNYYIMQLVNNYANKNPEKIKFIKSTENLAILRE